MELREQRRELNRAIFLGGNLLQFVPPTTSRYLVRASVGWYRPYCLNCHHRELRKESLNPIICYKRNVDWELGSVTESDRLLAVSL